VFVEGGGAPVPRHNGQSKPGGAAPRTYAPGGRNPRAATASDARIRPIHVAPPIATYFGLLTLLNRAFLLLKRMIIAS